MLTSTCSVWHPEIILRRAYFHIASRTMAWKQWYDDTQSYPEKSRYPLTYAELCGMRELIDEVVTRIVLSERGSK